MSKVDGSAVADAVAPSDPMVALAPLADVGPATPRANAKGYQRKRQCECAFTVDMPVLPPEAGAEAVAAGTRSVTVMGRGRNKLFIAVNDVDWLISYVAKEAALGGVAVVPPSRSGG